VTPAPHPNHWRVLGAVAVGGAVGALMRWALVSLFPDSSTGFPWTVFTINVVGCFVLAYLPAFPAVREKPLLPPLLGTGVLGGFTTMSAYAEQARALAANGRVVLSGVYVLGTLVTCLLAVVVADRFSTARDRQEFDEEEGDL